MRYGDLAVLVAALFFIRDLVFNLNTARASFNHLLSHKISRFSITKARINIRNNWHYVSFKIIDLRLNSCLSITLGRV